MSKGTMAIKNKQNYLKVEIPRLGFTRLLGIDLGPPLGNNFRHKTDPNPGLDALVGWTVLK